MPHKNSLCYEFGPYQFDLSKRELKRAGETIPLSRKAIEILIVLLANAGKVVEKDELLREVWPNTFVEEANLAQHVFTLRKALGDERAVPRYIETVTRRGYRFLGTVRAIEPDENQANARIVNQVPVVAVLPFLNISGDADWEYLADGLTDNLINNLSRVSQLHVMSHSAVARFKDLDPQRAGNELGATAVLVGKLNLRNSCIVVSVELVDASTGWQLWGESFDSESQDILEIQDAIARQLLVALKLQLTGEEEKRITARYTENAEAYQSYLEGRYHWSKYTRKGIDKAIGHFRHAIELDSNYALAYAAIVDCYLRLVTNYLPPEDDLQSATSVPHHPEAEPDSRIKLRFEWDWKTVERELRRASELKTNYPSPHQWYVAYQTSKQLYTESLSQEQRESVDKHSPPNITSQITSTHLPPAEVVQILCAVARDQIAIGNFEAANLILRRWSTDGRWPRLDQLNPYTAADLLFTLGTLLASVAGTKRVIHGHKHAEIFLSGSTALFEQLGIKTRSVEARIELARCYYRQGGFDIARSMLADALADLPDDEPELRTSGLALWGAVERDSGRLVDALTKLRETLSLGTIGDSLTARCYHELAITLKDFTMSEGLRVWAEEAELYFEKTLYVCEAIGNHRYSAAAENNFGFLLLSLGSFEAAEQHLLRSKRLFACLSDRIREAQVNETLARLYVETRQYSAAQAVIQQAVETLECTDGEALLAEALTTSGVIAARQGRSSEARKSLEAAYKVAERCGDDEGAGRALLIMLEEFGDCLDHTEKTQAAEKLRKLLGHTQQTGLHVRVQKCIDHLEGQKKAFG